MAGTQGVFTGTICSACSHALRPSSVSRHLMGFPSYVAICLILLSSCSSPCLAFWNTEGRHVRQLQQTSLAGSTVEDLANVSVSSAESNLSSPVQRASTSASESLYEGASGRSLNTAATIKATLQTILGVRALLGHQSLDVYTAAAAPGVGESGPNNELGVNGPHKALLAPFVTAPDPNVKGDVASTTTGEMLEEVGGGAGPGAMGSLEGDIFTPGILEGGKSVGPSGSSSLTTDEGRASLPVLINHPTSSFSSAVRFVSSEQGPIGGGRSVLTGTDATAKPTLAPTHAASNLEAEISANWEPLEGALRSTTAAAAVPQSDEWDDTKFGPASRGSAMRPMIEGLLPTVTELYLAVGGEEDEEDDVKKVLSPRLTAGKGRENIQTGSGQLPVPGEEATPSSDSLDSVHATGEAPTGSTVENADPAGTYHSRLFPETATTTDVTKSDIFQTLRSPLRATAFHGIGAVLPAMTPGGFGSQETAGRERAMEAEIALATHMPTAPSKYQLLKKSENSAAPVSPFLSSLSVVNTMDTEESMIAPGEEGEAASIASTPAILAEQRAQTKEILGTMEAMAGPPTLASLTRRTTVPDTRQITTAAAYELERLESEEEEEEEEEEPEEEEEEEEEEDDDFEDDRDPTSMDESLDEDANLSSFTLPGETSQEPLEGLENPAGELLGISYQVPNTIEWEQQNQGLVRSWMEKLKDKAGYMSGMLVPVGVGIAGALFILGALYSIKIMNRRRRNGFKRHKRKQREFNSMQDRVMLLADSSEDEF
ncbi:armadillo-like helical domain-containing protein 4 isoform X2 [Rhineura floridana]|uniref:armadillo-like helical domain-containing protein 4 isoform X2 n=1 Tax=Rhineura floridana TaxID=261503 RepID=UPI002AC83817|nr:armadillo-like helical domain-containing protein 4 isoform X2 [Rhineura floridana]